MSGFPLSMHGGYQAQTSVHPEHIVGGQSGTSSQLVIICQPMTHWSGHSLVASAFPFSRSCSEAVSRSPRKPRFGLYQTIPGLSGWNPGSAMTHHDRGASRETNLCRSSYFPRIGDLPAPLCCAGSGKEGLCNRNGPVGRDCPGGSGSFNGIPPHVSAQAGFQAADKE